MQVFWTKTAVARLSELEPTDSEIVQLKGVGFDPSRDPCVPFNPLEGKRQIHENGRFCLVYNVVSAESIEVVSVIDITHFS